MIGGVTHLLLSGNHITAIPEEIGNLTALNVSSKQQYNRRSVRCARWLSFVMELDLSHNQLSAVPTADIWWMRDLQVLQLNRNRISTMSGEPQR